MTSPKIPMEPRCDDARPDAAQFCDGLHDEGAPERYLCSRCFPDVDLRGDLAPSQDAEDDDEYEQRRDADLKME